jgi:hypothetical protein
MIDVVCFIEMKRKAFYERSMNEILKPAKRLSRLRHDLFS